MIMLTLTVKVLVILIAVAADHYGGATRVQNGNYLAPTTPHQRTPALPRSRPDSACFRAIRHLKPFDALGGSVRMSDDAKFILGFG